MMGQPAGTADWCEFDVLGQACRLPKHHQGGHLTQSHQRGADISPAEAALVPRKEIADLGPEAAALMIQLMQTSANDASHVSHALLEGQRRQYLELARKFCAFVEDIERAAPTAVRTVALDAVLRNYDDTYLQAHNFMVANPSPQREGASNEA